LQEELIVLDGEMIMSLSKRLEEARRAFARGDMAASAAAHTPERIVEAAKEEHGGAGS
jgi:hypothetical protein